MSKVVVISGATSGIGRATCDQFSKNGYKVYGLARERCDNFPYEFEACDLTKTNELNAAVANILAKEDNIDVLICTAGMGISGVLEKCEMSSAKRLFDLNFFAAFALAQAFLPRMREQGYGKIIFISSVGAIFPLPYQAFYSASKSALETMANAWRIEVKPLGVQIGCVLPGDTKTSFTQNREKATADSDYNGRDEKSVAKMEKDEQNGMTAEYVAKKIYRFAAKKRLPVRTIVGFKYKVFAFLCKILPTRFVLYILTKMYG